MTTQINTLLNQMLTDFSNSNLAGSQTLQSALLASPELLALYNNLAAGTHGAKITGFVGDTTEGANGSFSDRAIHIKFVGGTAYNGFGQPMSTADLIFTLGHEGQHARDQYLYGSADELFATEATKILNSNN